MSYTRVVAPPLLDHTLTFYETMSKKICDSNNILGIVIYFFRHRTIEHGNRFEFFITRYNGTKYKVQSRYRYKHLNKYKIVLNIEHSLMLCYYNLT